MWAPAGHLDDLLINLEASAIFWVLDVITIVLLLPLVLDLVERRKWRKMRLSIVIEILTTIQRIELLHGSVLYNIEQVVLAKTEEILIEFSNECDATCAQLREYIQFCSPSISPDMSIYLIDIYSDITTLPGPLRNTLLEATHPAWDGSIDPTRYSLMLNANAIVSIRMHLAEMLFSMCKHIGLGGRTHIRDFIFTELPLARIFDSASRNDPGLFSGEEGARRALEVENAESRWDQFSDDHLEPFTKRLARKLRAVGASIRQRFRGAQEPAR